MDYLFLIGAVFLIASISVLAGFYNRRTETQKDASALYSLIFISGVLCFWFVMLIVDGFDVNAKVIPYCLIFSAGYTTCIVSLVYALKCGPVGLTSLFLQLSIISATSPLSPSLVYSVIGVGGLMVTTLFSVLVFKEKMNLQKWLGLIIGTVAIGILSI